MVRNSAFMQLPVCISFTSSFSTKHRNLRCPPEYDYIRPHNGRCSNFWFSTMCSPDPSFGEPCSTILGSFFHKRFCCKYACASFLHRSSCCLGAIRMSAPGRDAGWAPIRRTTPTAAMTTRLDAVESSVVPLTTSHSRYVPLLAFRRDLCTPRRTTAQRLEEKDAMRYECSILQDTQHAATLRGPTKTGK